MWGSPNVGAVVPLESLDSIITGPTFLGSTH